MLHCNLGCVPLTLTTLVKSFHPCRLLDVKQGQTMLASIAIVKRNAALITRSSHLISIRHDATASVVLFFLNHDGAERLARSSIRLLPNLATTDVRNFTFLIKLLELSVLVR